MSNKEDTENAIIQLGIALEEKDKIINENNLLKKDLNSQLEINSELNRRNSNLYKYGNFITPLLPIGLMTAGGILIYNNKINLGENLFLIGGITLISFELVFQSGHWMFKIF